MSMKLIEQNFVRRNLSFVGTEEANGIANLC